MVNETVVLMYTGLLHPWKNYETKWHNLHSGQLKFCVFSYVWMIAKNIMMWIYN